MCIRDRYQDDPGVQRLIAFYTGSEAIEAADLRGFLSEQLPEYMVPAVYSRLRDFPLTHNGKIDRQALSELSVSIASNDSEYEPPSGEIEKQLASIWSAILKTNQIGRQDNFFDLGGHSLLVMQMVAKIRVALFVNIPMRWVFDHSTIAQLAESIDNKKWMTENIPLMHGETGEEGEL